MCLLLAVCIMENVSLVAFLCVLLLLFGLSLPFSRVMFVFVSKE